MSSYRMLSSPASACAISTLNTTRPTTISAVSTTSAGGRTGGRRGGEAVNRASLQAARHGLAAPVGQSPAMRAEAIGRRLASTRPAAAASFLATATAGPVAITQREDY